MRVELGKRGEQSDVRRRGWARRELKKKSERKRSNGVFKIKTCAQRLGYFFLRPCVVVLGRIGVLHPAIALRFNEAPARDSQITEITRWGRRAPYKSDIHPTRMYNRVHNIRPYAAYVHYERGCTPPSWENEPYTYCTLLVDRINVYCILESSRVETLLSFFTRYNDV